MSDEKKIELAEKLIELFLLAAPTNELGKLANKILMDNLA